jgi:hypothetical protein
MRAPRRVPGIYTAPPPRLPGTLFFQPAPVAAPNQGVSPQQGGGAIPFIVGSNQYRESPFSDVSVQLGANSAETVAPVTPGGFLRGVTIQVTSTLGVIGGAALVADAPWSILSNLSLEDISGGPVLYGMSGFAHYIAQKYFRPWAGDPTKRSDFSNTINPAFTLQFFVEITETLAVLANTDARAQYRLRYTLAPGVQSGQFGLTTIAPTTQPTVRVKCSLESWAQPDLQDLLGHPIEQEPGGVIASRFLMHENPPVNSGNNVTRLTLVGNEIRALALIFRNGDATKTRQNLTDANAGAIDFRLDNRRLWKALPSQLVERMQDFYPLLGAGTWTREAGVYVIPRFRLDRGDEYWLQTVEQSLLQLEYSGTDLTTAPGTVEAIYDQLAIAGQLPGIYEGM